MATNGETLAWRDAPAVYIKRSNKLTGMLYCRFTSAFGYAATISTAYGALLCLWHGGGAAQT